MSDSNVHDRIPNRFNPAGNCIDVRKKAASLDLAIVLGGSSQVKHGLSVETAFGVVLQLAVDSLVKVGAAWHGRKTVERISRKGRAAHVLLGGRGADGDVPEVDV